jgi:hypothetical protein
MLTHLDRPRSQRAHRTAGRSAAPRPRGATVRSVLPEDAALYVCACGNAFTAAVTAHVTCPACGDGQAW